MAYEYDVFLSYTTAASNGAWVREHFFTVFQGCLDNAMPRAPTVFMFEDQESATAWPENLANALRTSRVLVAVISPPYFRSSWCLAEWTSMLERERATGYGTPGQPRLLIHPVVYADGVHFPPEAQRNFSRDFSSWNYPFPHFRDTPAYLQFFDAVEQLANDVAARIDDVPEWTDQFPILRPDPAPAGSARLERLT